MIKKEVSSSDTKYILDHPDLTNSEIAKHLGLTVHQVRGVFRRNGVKKVSSYHNNKGWFVKGTSSWNKGVKMDDETREKVKHTFFKKGHTPPNTKPVGSIRIYKDKIGKYYKLIKVVNKRKWQPLQRIVWEEANGPIPKGMLVVFKDGDTLNCELSNLELISKEENMSRNSITRYPTEVISTIVQLAHLNKQINKSQK